VLSVTPPPDRLTGDEIYRVTYPRAIRILFIFSGFMTFLLAFFGWMAFREEGVQVGAYVALFFGAGGIFWFQALARSPYRVEFAADHLVVYRWGRQDRMAYTAISGLKVTRRWIILRRAGPVAGPDLRLHKHHANADAMVVTALETLVPTLRAQRLDRLRRTLPFTVTNKWGFPLSMAIAGLIFLGVTGIAFNFAWQENLWSQEWFLGAGMGTLFVFCGLLFLHITLWDAVLRFTFTAGEIRLRYALRTQRFPTTGLTAIHQAAAPTTVRGVPRTQYHVDLTYADGSTRRLSPNGGSFPSDYIDAQEQAATAELAQVLRSLYLPKPIPAQSQPEIMPEIMPETAPEIEPTPASPDILATYPAPDYGFILHVEDHGPSPTGASIIHMVVNPPLAGVGHFLTADGGGFVDPTGRFVVIHDDRLIVVFDLAENRPYHMAAPRGRRLVNVAHEVGYVIFDTVGRAGGEPIPGRVLSLDPISRRLRPGLGTAESGVFPSLSPLRIDDTITR
jgi:hypothetical protein